MRDFWLGWWGTIFFSGGFLWGWWYAHEHPRWDYEWHVWLAKAWVDVEVWVTRLL